VIGLVCFVLLYLSALWNRDKNQTYAIGVLYLLSLYSIAQRISWAIRDPETSLIFFIRRFFFFFGLIITIAFLFFLLMTGVKLILERTQ
jgi:hypothetical protein